MAQTVEIRFTDGVQLTHEPVFSHSEEGSFYRIRELEETFLYPTHRIYKIAIKEGATYDG